MASWDKALSTLTHVQDYALDLRAVLAAMDGFDISNSEFMSIVTRCMPEPPPDGSDCVVGKHVPASVGMRVVLLPPIPSQGTGTVTEVPHLPLALPHLSAACA